jgi:hypothetical protein
VSEKPFLPFLLPGDPSLKQMVRRYFNYHAVPGNLPRLSTFCREISRTWWATLRRRSQRGRWM